MRQRRLGWGAVLVVWLGLFGSGCALNVSLESDPDPGIVGQPVNYTVEVMNASGCDLDNPFLFVAVLIPEIQFGDDNITELVCNAFQEPELLLCDFIDDPQDPEIPSQIISTCCEGDPDFADEHPEACENQAHAPMTSEGLRSEIARFLANNPIENANASNVSITTSEGEAVNCVQLFDIVFICEDMQLLNGQTLQVNVAATPMAPGHYYNFAFAFGEPDDCDPDLLPAGSQCTETQVVASAAAPALSPWAIAFLLVSLGVIGRYALQRRRT